MIFLNTPNNPTGQLIPIADLRRIADAAPHAVVLIDEAYIEFGGETFLPHLPRYPNVLIGRTFSKAYGLAGMRVGILIGQPQSLDAVRAVTLPFNINGVAMAATLAALEDREFLPRYAEQVAQSRTRLYEACRSLGLPFWESAANFVLVQVGDAVPLVVQALGSARRARPRSLEGSDDAGMHPDHGRHARPHDRRDRGARVGGRREAAMKRSDDVQSRDDRDADYGRADDRRPRPLRRPHRHPLLRSHARAVHAARRLRSHAEGDWRSRRRPAPHRRRRRHRARRIAAQGARRPQGHQSRRLLRHADGRNARRRRRRLERPARTRSSI